MYATGTAETLIQTKWESEDQHLSTSPATANPGAPSPSMDSSIWDFDDICDMHVKPPIPVLSFQDLSISEKA